MYRTGSGSIKYETVISVRIRFNIESENLNDADMIARRMANDINRYITSKEQYNKPTSNAVASLDAEQAMAPNINVTMVYEQVEGTDYANRFHTQPSVWNHGSYLSNATLAHRWNTRLRFLNADEQNSEYRRFDTAENLGRYTMPSMPRSVLNQLVNQQTIAESTHSAIDRIVLDTVLPQLEGMYEDAVLETILKEGDEVDPF